MCQGKESECRTQVNAVFLADDCEGVHSPYMAATGRHGFPV